MTQPQRVLPDLTVAAAEFGANFSKIICPIVWHHLANAYPDGVRISELADWHRLSLQDAVDLVAAAEAAGKVKARRLIAGGIQFVWLAGTVPPLSGVEKRLLRIAQRDLADGPNELFQTVIAADLQVSPGTLRRALEFLVSADLVTREGKTFALTDLGRTEGDPE